MQETEALIRTQWSENYPHEQSYEYIPCFHLHIFKFYRGDLFL